MSENRYIRQTTLPEVGAAGQARLRESDILVIGAGGLGVPVLDYLVGAGIGRITLIDPDTVSRNNLHRQTLYREGEIGYPKADAAAATLARLNPDCAITPVTEQFTPANASILIADKTLVLDCADSFAASYIASDTCLAQGIPLISASALSLGGYVGGFCASAPSLRAVFPDLPETAMSCATAGVLGPVVGTLGSLQAQMALSVLLDLDPSPLGQLITFDARALRFGGFRFDTAAEPEMGYQFIASADISETDMIVDLRSFDEVKTPVHPSAHRRTVETFDLLPEPDQRAVLACRSGLRAWRAANTLRETWDGEIALVALGDQEETQ